MSAADKPYAEFAAAIYQGAPLPAECQGGLNYDLAAGMAVYHNNYRGNLQDALAGHIP
jgi:hypothetical protein